VVMIEVVGRVVEGVVDVLVVFAGSQGEWAMVVGGKRGQLFEKASALSITEKAVKNC
nr:hypothetical protein [Tanacetum cinerariifolium]